ncbi:hypothetical protein ACFL27_11160, partial [candidate division CSSED10-310 bacterium]
MAQFEGVQWAEKQMRFLLNTKQQDFLASDAPMFAVSRSVHYGLFLAFEGIRFYCQSDGRGKLEIVFVNWRSNLERFCR